MSTLKVDTIQKTNGSAPELSDLGVTTGYEVHWWGYSGSQSTGADSIVYLNAFTTFNNTDDADGTNEGVSLFKEIGSNSFTHSSGVWTFPRTGTWKITATINLQDNDADSRHVNISIDISSNSGSSYSPFNTGYDHFKYISSNTYLNLTGYRIVNVTDASTFRCRIGVLSNTDLDVIRNKADFSPSHLMFERVADAQ
tara:strand:+ start:57 stop:647 length:591 start_codon:yes stop_codon:yes gene_type:complete